MTSRLLPDRRDDRQRPARSSRSSKGTTTSRTATPSAATRSRRRWRWPTSTSSSARASTSTSATNEPAFRATLEKLLDLPIVGDVRGDGYFYGIELVKDKATKETFDDDESERLLRGFLSKALFDAGLLLPRRRPRRPGRPARAAADHRPARVRRDRADAARRPHRGREAPVAREPRGPARHHLTNLGMVPGVPANLWVLPGTTSRT